MPRQLVNKLWNPFRYPEWVEICFAVLGLLQTVLAFSLFDELHLRTSLYLVLAFGVTPWCCTGAILFLLHMIPLRFGDRPWSYRWRIYAAAASSAFWGHFVLAVAAASVISGTDLPVSILPALAAPLFASGILFRLWKHY